MNFPLLFSLFLLHMHTLDRLRLDLTSLLHTQRVIDLRVCVDLEWGNVTNGQWREEKSMNSAEQGKGVWAWLICQSLRCCATTFFFSSDHWCNAIWRIWTRISNEMSIHLSILVDNKKMIKNSKKWRRSSCLSNESPEMKMTLSFGIRIFRKF